jgi:hypothetical protein
MLTPPGRIALAVASTLALIALGTPGAVAVSKKSLVPTVARYGVFEHAIGWRATGDSSEQARVDVTLRAPSGRVATVEGFDAGPDTVKFRFAPAQLGTWSWNARVSDGARTSSFNGRFQVVKGPSPGFVRRSPYNRFRWTFQNGAPYYPIGINDCTVSFLGAKPIAEWGLDGEFRPPNSHEGTRLVGIDTYMKAYSAAGFNLFRWGPDNCSFSLYERIDPAGNVYSTSGGAYADRLFKTLRRYRFHIEMVLFGANPPPFANEAGDVAKMDAVKAYVRYVVDRYGAYVDYWELMNEASASDEWDTQVAAYLHSIDPYHHPVGTNWSRPELPAMDFGADHWYETEDELQSDSKTWDKFQHSSAHAVGKPTLIDEQGNVDQNWDTRSAVRMRLRAWTAFFAEGSLVFWNASFAKDYKNAGAANLYLGPQERRYVRVLQNFTAGFDPRAKIASATVSGPAATRGYALRGPSEYAAYIVATENHDSEKTGLKATVDPQRRGTARWIDPDTGKVLRSVSVTAGRQSLAVPAFTTDIALLIS